MRIGFNAQILADAATGVARYAEEMLRALVRKKGSHELVVFGRRERLAGVCPQEWIVPTPSMLTSAARRIVWEQAILPSLHTKYRLDVMYYPDHTAPMMGTRCKTVITIHDLVPFAFPDAHRFARRTYKRIALQRSAKLAERVVAISHSTQKDCTRWLGIPPEKIDVIHLGVHESFSPVHDHAILEKVRDRHGIRRPFILFVGTIERRKNLVRLIDAYEMARSSYGVHADLVLAGGKGNGTDEILQRVERSPVQEHIKLLGFVPDEDLPALYSMAEAFVYPSLYEGFGLPVVEAMACGCPVVVSNSTSLPEVVGDAGITVDPYDTLLLAEALAGVVNGRELQDRLRAAGQARARQFSWKEAAERLIALMASLTT